LFFARPAPKKPSPPLFPTTGCEKRHKDPNSIFRIFHTIGLLSPPESEIRAGKLLVDPGHLQEELVGGRPHHHYIKACHHRPRVDRGLQKNTHIVDDHAKNYLNQLSILNELFSSYVALRICFLTHLVLCPGSICKELSVSGTYIKLGSHLYIYTPKVD
jgi:hypothetical protein